MPTLSIVVPFYNVAPYFSELLDSLAAQELKDIEVVLVDDGSTDSSPRTAAARVAEDERFSLVTQPNRGLSAARNAGALRATGSYLAFADSDDVVPPAAYRVLVESLERTGSDFASGDVRRLDSSGTHRHPRYADVFATARSRTHITRDRDLILDRMIWNKVFRRSFWEQHRFAFSLAQYEDAPVTVRAHIEARTVDVVGEVVYHWRIREAGERSITQRLYEPDNIAARMRMMAVTGDVVREHAPELLPVYERDMCLGDLRIAMHAMLENTDRAMATALDIGRGFLARVDGRVIGQLPDPDRHRLALLLAGRSDELRASLRADGQ
ncbi:MULTISPECIES: glycosyltransferase family 2 protein [Streptacidiphilus]|uniref:Glycosyltransferase family 2 protein n=1 Tax=Streptacidiphilus cavernicola TaxID=3342716 RepID=A0ABV6UTX9_9ACTN|nr:glycosyltransferase family 2 protein [Streptacidiphilus jeojiense]